MRSFFIMAFVAFAQCLQLFSAPFTVCSYNCGALSDHYDYIRAACLHKLMQMRYNEEPELIHQLQKIQSIALKKLFSQEAAAAQEEWDRNGYEKLFFHITNPPHSGGSPNKKWLDLSEKMLTSYKERPVIIYDQEISAYLLDHTQDLTRSQESSLTNESLNAARSVMAMRIFKHELQYDIIALQEADYLNSTLFPEKYEVRFSPAAHSVNGVAWNKKRFELVEEMGDIMGRGFAVLLKEIDCDKQVLVISAHLTGCNPYFIENEDSTKGDNELQTLLEITKSSPADIKILLMDSNVTATHPRLQLLKDAGFTLDCEKFLEPTCTSPWQILDNRIDWIAVQSASISNIPVNGVGLNSPQTNMSDHKPIAAIVGS